MRIPVFLDRDGVINKEPSDFGMDYVSDLKYFKLLPKVSDALDLLSKNGYDIYIISNQAGVNKGLFTFDKLMQITDRMLRDLESSGVKISEIKYCPHREDENCDCRKPKTKFLEEIFNRYKSLNKNLVFFVGDQPRDIATALNFGIRSILLLSGKTKIAEVFTLKVHPDFIATDLYDAVKHIILK